MGRLRHGLTASWPWVGWVVWLGLLDAYWVLRGNADLAGTWADRAAAVTLGIAIDVAVLLFAAGLMLIPAWILARLTGLRRSGLHVALTVSAVVTLTGVVIAEDAEVRGLLPASIGVCAGGVLLLAIVAGLLTLLVLWRGGERQAGTSTNPPRGFVATCLAVVVGVVGITVGWPQPSLRRDPARPNVLLISLDTLRADHVSSYGYDRHTTPNIDAIAGRGAVFENVSAQSHWTFPSHASMLTGLTPQAMGLSGGGRISREFTTLAERLAERGYRTAAFVGMSRTAYIGAARGFDQGFERYSHPPFPTRGLRTTLARAIYKAYWRFVVYKTGQAGPQVNHALRWMTHHRDEPFFLFLHLFDIHSDIHQLPYEAPHPFRDMFDPDYDGDFTGCGPTGKCASEFLQDYVRGAIEVPMAEDDLQRMICLYDGGIAYTDHQLGRLFDGLDASGLTEHTVVIITSDHGEAFFEHGTPLHCDLKEENLRVPLIIVAPTAPAGSRIPSLVQVLDIVPTVLDLTGTPSTGFLQGRSLAPMVMTGEAAALARPAFGFRPNAISLRTDDWKYIHHKAVGNRESAGQFLEELYDLRTDPGEQYNVASTADPALSADLYQQVVAEETAGLLIRKGVLVSDEADSLTLSPRQLEELRSLGYIH